MKRGSILCWVLLFSAPARPQELNAGRKQFETRCSGCHGTDGRGGELGPNIVDARRRGGPRTNLRDVIRNGIPDGGMPAFPLPEPELDAVVTYIGALRAPAADHPAPGDPEGGRRFFMASGNCLRCHMVKGQGGALGPDLTNLARERRLPQIEQAIRNPAALSTPGYRVASVRLRDGKTLRGLIKNQSNYDIQLQGLDGQIHLLSRDQVAEVVRGRESLMPAVKANAGEMRDLLAFLTRLTGEVSFSVARDSQAEGGVTFREIANPRPGEWPTYHGHLSGNRHSPLREIDTGNVARLGAQWMFPVANARRLEGTPVVVDGMMYVTAANEAYALDARSGRPLWHYARPLTKGVIGDAAGAINRGVAVLGDKVFMVTDHAHLLALDRRNGALLWETEMADYREHYGATSAPLIVKDLVLSGTSGGDEGARGFVAAYKASTGERVWRFRTMPLPGDPEAATWGGRAIEHGCVTAWLTGTYDPAADLVYWPTGNPCPDFNGEERKGDNLYSDSVLALEPATGKLRWHYQFTPHDLHDWDSTETPMLIDAEYGGRQRRLLVQANRNGFFYVLDRISGEFLSGRPFVHKLTWATGIAADGRPEVVPESMPTVQGTKACPSVHGATNWMSTAYNPATRLFYVMAFESCSIYTKSSAWWEPGKSFYGGGTRNVPGETSERFLRAIDVGTGKIVWELPQTGAEVPDGGWGGVLSTAGGLVFFCDDTGAFAAADARTGKPLWHFHTNQAWRASPMTYMIDGKQYVAVASGSNVIAFALR